MNALLQALQARVSRVSTDRLDLLAASRDLWPRNTLAMAQGAAPELPLAICWPETHDEVLSLLAWAGQQGLPVVPYGAGSGVCGGAAAGAGSIVLDTKRMQAIGPVDGEGLRVVVGPGVMGQVLEDTLEQRGYLTRHSPSSIWCSTPGGWAAARSAGQFSSMYGKFEDMVLAMRVATPTGTVFTGSDTPAGAEDLGPVIMGSEGTLGIITELAVRVVPVPATRWLRGYAFPDLPTALSAMQHLMQAELWPVVMRLYDPVDTRIGGKLGPPRVHRASRPSRLSLGGLWRAVEGWDALRHNEFSLPLAWPAPLNAVAGQLGRRVLFIVGFEGEPALVQAQAAAAAPILAAGEDMGAAAGESWYAHRHDVSYKMSPVFARGAFADTMEVASTWSRLEPMYHAVRHALAKTTLVMAHFSHAYPEGCSIYFSFMGRGDLGTYDLTWKSALAAVRAAGGTVTHHHGVGVLKAEAATLEMGHARRVFDRRKAMLDPGGVMNPGRVFTSRPPADEGPGRPEGEGPVYHVDRGSLLARVDPQAEPVAIQHALAGMGLALRYPPDRPLAAWLRAFRPSAHAGHTVPLFGLQARFADGCSARVGVAPRSAAGPDLRWGLLLDATPEWVEVPLISTFAAKCTLAMPPGDAEAASRALLRRGLRPRARWVGAQSALHVLLAGAACAAQAEGLEQEGACRVEAEPPPLPPHTALSSGESSADGSPRHG